MASREDHRAFAGPPLEDAAWRDGRGMIQGVVGRTVALLAGRADGIAAGVGARRSRIQIVSPPTTKPAMTPLKIGPTRLDVRPAAAASAGARGERRAGVRAVDTTSWLLAKKFFAPSRKSS